MALALEQLDRIRRLTEVSRRITNAASLDEILELAVERASELLAAPGAILAVLHNDGQLRVRASHNVPPERLLHFPTTLDESVASRLGVALDVEDFLAVPLVIAGEVRGLLAVGREPVHGDGAIHEEWLLSALADQAALAIERAGFDESLALRERLLGIVGHDLRNPLNAISMAADVLATDSAADSLPARLATRISASVRRMSWLLDQLADFARIRLGGGFPLDLGETDIHALCADVVEELTIAQPEARVELERDDGDGHGLWDGARIEQLVSNLVGNAIQHGARGRPIRVAVSATAGDIAVSVHNEGDAIPDDVLAVIFDPFRRGRAVNGHAAGGARSRASLGLGLYIAREIARAHGGSLGVRSDGRGTVFTMRVPRWPASS